MQVRTCEFCEIFKKGYSVVHMGTAVSDTLEYPYIGISCARFTWKKKCTVFPNILGLILFKLILKSCLTSGVYLEPYQTSMTKAFAVEFSQKRSIIDIGQDSKYGSAASVFNIFPLSSFGYLNEYMNILFFF